MRKIGSLLIVLLLILALVAGCATGGKDPGPEKTTEPE